MCSATTVAEARYLEDHGIDIVVAQGIEAGGHRGTFLGADVGVQSGLFSLLPQVVDAAKVPVIAAGGIADGRAIASALMLGAVAFWLEQLFCVVVRRQCLTPSVPLWALPKRLRRYLPM